MADIPDEISPATPSTKPYFLRALYEWCTDNGFTPYVAVVVDASTRVPNEYVKDGQIVLNVSFDATSNLRIANDFITFAARFGGVAREISVPIERVAAIYARENGQGMAFEVTDVQAAAAAGAAQPGVVSPGAAPPLVAVPALAPAPMPSPSASLNAAPKPAPGATLGSSAKAASTPSAAPEHPKKDSKPKFTVVK